MSYDLMVFSPKAAPSGRDKFIKWYHQQSELEDHDYNNPDALDPELRAWFMEMITHYPPMNGPLQSDDIDNPKVTDYSIGKSSIYAAFAWSEAEAAFKTTTQLVEKHKMGFFDVSSKDGKVWIPDESGKYVCIHSE
jgi:hypothetical protein